MIIKHRSMSLSYSLYKDDLETKKKRLKSYFLMIPKYYVES